MRKIKIFSWILSIITFLLVLLPIVPFSTVNSQSVYAVSENDGVDFRNGTIKYALTDTLRDVPNTFEAIVKIEKGQECDTSLGYIFSNMLTRVNLTYSVEVTAKGNPKLIWNSYEKQVVFDKVDLRNGEWTHIAIVRQKSQGGFVLYVNGMLVQQILCGVGDDIYDFSLRHVIGGDWNAGNAVHKPFMGKIRQVTLYNRELNESDVANDYNNSDKINYSSRTGLMFNAKLVKGEVAYDTSAYRNHAEMATNDYLYEGDLYEGHDYTIALMPDLQCITNHYESALKYPFDFLLDIKNTKNVKMVAALGDVTDGYSNNGGKWSNGSGSTAVSRDQYNLVGAQFERLGAAGIQNFAVPGNHDYDNECKSGVTQSGTDGPSDPNGIKGHAVSLFDKEFKDTTLSYGDNSNNSFILNNKQ